jgi:hypothetical protein
MTRAIWPQVEIVVDWALRSPVARYGMLDWASSQHAQFPETHADLTSCVGG